MGTNNHPQVGIHGTAVYGSSALASFFALEIGTNKSQVDESRVVV